MVLYSYGPIWLWSYVATTLGSHGLYSCDLYSDGLYGNGLYSYGLYGHGLYSYDRWQRKHLLSYGPI